MAKIPANGFQNIELFHARAVVRKYLLFRIGAVCVGVTACCGLLEIGLRWFPVNEGLQVMPVNAESPIPHFTPNRASIWSRTWNFSVVNTIQTNNYGFISEQDYEPNAAAPVIALIGDSYIEAARLPWTQTAAARLQYLADGRARVYAFGMSGAPLSLYLRYAEFAANEFHPERLVILVVGNDFDESLLRYNARPGGYYFDEGQHGELELQRVDYSINVWRKVIRHSKLGMYLATNVALFHHLLNFADLFRGDAAFVGNTAAVSDEQRIFESQRAVDAFLYQLPERSQLPPAHILLAIDGIRPQLYDDGRLAQVNDSYFAVMRRYFLEHARRAGFGVLDMQPVFQAQYQRHHQRFEFPDDAHWNALGHQVFAESVAQSSVVRSLFHHGLP